MKFIKAKLASSIISIDNASFATLARYGGGTSIYSFSYTINTVEALKKNALKVKVLITTVIMTPYPFGLHINDDFLWECIRKQIRQCNNKNHQKFHDCWFNETQLTQASKNLIMQINFYYLYFVVFFGLRII